MTNNTTNPYRDVVEDLARSRGMSADELVHRAAALDPEHTPGEFLEKPPGGFGATLDRILHMDREEKRRLSEAFRVVYLEGVRGLRRRVEGAEPQSIRLTLEQHEESQRLIHRADALGGALEAVNVAVEYEEDRGYAEHLDTFVREFVEQEHAQAQRDHRAYLRNLGTFPGDPRIEHDAGADF